MGEGVGVASACASATVVNAIAAGKGAAFGVDLRVQARVELTKNKGISGRVLGGKESPKLIEICVRRALEDMGLRKTFGALVETSSDIPIAVGLSSSSAAANASVLATFAAAGKKPEPKRLLDIGIDSAFEAGVTITGALDDAAASYFGYGVATDNLKRKILRKFNVDPKLAVVESIPSFSWLGGFTKRIAAAPCEAARAALACSWADFQVPFSLQALWPAAFIGS